MERDPRSRSALSEAKKCPWGGRRQSAKQVLNTPAGDAGDVNAVSECRLVRLFPFAFGPVKRGHPTRGAHTNRRSHCPSTHPVCSRIGVRDKPSPGRGRRPGRFGSGKRLLLAQRTTLAPSLYFRSHPAERGGKEMAAGEGGPIPSPLPVLLPLEKGRGDRRLGSGERSRIPTRPASPLPRFSVSPFLRLLRPRPRRLFLSSIHQHSPQRGRLPTVTSTPSTPAPPPLAASSLLVLLPLEKGLRALAFVPDHSSKRPGVCPGPLRFTDRACDHRP